MKKTILSQKTLAVLITVLVAVSLVGMSATAAGPAESAGTIVAFEALAPEVAAQAVPVGTALEQLNLPPAVVATVECLPEASDGEQGVRQSLSVPLSWSAAPSYNADSPGSYTFSASVSGYTVSGVLPQIVVRVYAPETPPAEVPSVEETVENAVITSFEPIDAAVLQQLVPQGTPLQQLALPVTLAATVERGGISQREELPVSWVPQPLYEASTPGQYRFSAALSGGYLLAPQLALPEINVWVTMAIAPASGTMAPVKENLAYALPTGLVYNGSPQAPLAVTGAGDFDETTGGTITVYYGEGAEKSQTPPTNAGTYPVTVDTTGGTLYQPAVGLALGDYTVGKATGLTAEAKSLWFCPGDGEKAFYLDSLQLTAPQGATGPLTYALGAFSDPSAVLTGQPVLSDSKLTYHAGANTGVATQQISISSANYQAITLTLTLTATSTLEDATVAITMPANQTYSNAITAPTATATALGQPVPDASFSFFYTGTTLLNAPYSSPHLPQKPGSYTVTATLQSPTHKGSASMNFVIEKGILSWNPGRVLDKVYDGDTAAAVDMAGGMPTLQGLVAGDNVMVDSGPVRFATKNVGGSIAVTATGWGIQGEHVAYYQPLSSQPLFANAAITQRVLDFTVNPVQRAYNGSTNIAVSVTLKNKLTGDDVTLTGTGLLDAPDAGERIVTLTSPVLAGTAQGNYTLPSPLPTGTVEIKKASGGFNFSGTLETTILESDVVENSWDLAATLTPSLTPPTTAGNVTFTVLSCDDPSAILVATPTIEGGTVLKYKGRGKTDGTATVKLKVSSDNYGDFMQDITLKAVGKTQVTVYVMQTGAVYSDALPAPQITLSPQPPQPYTLDISYKGTSYGPSPNQPTEPGTYTVTVTLVSDTHKGSGQANFTISKIQLRWSAPGTVADKDYDGSTSATVVTAPTLEGILLQHAGTIEVRAGSVYFGNSNAASGITMMVSNWGIQNVGTNTNLNYYTISGQPTFNPATINKLKLTATGTAQNREYNGQTAVAVALAVTNAPAGQTLKLTATGNMADANAGTGKPVTLTNFALTPGNTNYILPTSDEVPVTVTISKATSGFLVTRPPVIMVPESDTASHTVDLTSAFESVFTHPSGPLSYTAPAGKYTDATPAILAGGPSLSGSLLAYQGTGQPSGTASQGVIIESTNYVDIEVTLVFMAISGSTTWEEAILSVTISNLTVDKTIEYGTPLATPVTTVRLGGGDLDPSQYQLSYSYEGVRLDGAIYGPTPTPPDKPGSYTLTVTLNDRSTSSTHYYGGDSERFTITQKQLTWSANGKVNDKVYDGTTTTTRAAGGTPSLVGIVGADDVRTTEGTVLFATTGARDSVTVVASGWGMQGANILYYKAPVSQPVFAPAKIEKRQLTISYLTINNRGYNGSTAVSIVVTPVNRVSGDDVTLSLTGAVDDPNAGTDKPVTTSLSLLVMSGSSAANYLMPTALPTDPIKITINKVAGLLVDSPSNIRISADNVLENNLGLAPILNPRAPSGPYETGPIQYLRSTTNNTSGVLRSIPTVGADGLLTYTGGGKSSGTSTQYVTIQSQNYTDRTVTLTFEAYTKPATTVIMTTPVGVVYGEPFIPPTATTAAYQDTNQEYIILYEGYDDANNLYPESTTPPTKPGTYKAKARLTGSSTHAGTSTAIQYVISPCRLTWDGLGTVTTRPYDGTTNATPLTLPTLGGMIDPTDDVRVTTGEVKFGNANAGSHMVTAEANWNAGLTGAGLAYYLAPEDPPQFANGTITPKLLTISSAAAAPKTYNGSNYAQVTSLVLSGFVGGQIFTEADYVATGRFNDANAGTGRIITVEVYLNATPNTSNYAIDDQGYQLVNQAILVSDLTHANVEVAVNGSYRYSGSQQLPATSEVVVQVDGRTLEYGTDYTYAITNGGTQAGPVELTITGKGNYNGLKAKPGVYSILKRPITVRALSLSVEVGSGMPALSYTVEGAVPGETPLTGTPHLACPSANLSAVGQYEIVVDLSAVTYGSNYEAATPAAVKGTLTVTGGSGGSGGASGGGASGGSTSGGGTSGASADSSRPVSSGGTARGAGAISASQSSSGDGAAATGQAPTSPASVASSSQEVAAKETQGNQQTAGGAANAQPGNVPVLRVFGSEIPLFAMLATSAWSLVNLILTVAGVAMSLLLGLQTLRRSKARAGAATRKKATLWAGVAMAVAAGSVLLFLATQSMKDVMVLADVYTVVFSLLLAVQLLFALRAKGAATPQASETEG